MKGILEKRAYKRSAYILFIWLMLALVHPGPLSAAGECPQTRTTPTAPKEFLTLQNPLPLNDETLQAGETLYQLQGKPATCKSCHGIKGDGQSESRLENTPPARNFTCVKTMGALPDGQLFWIIRNGSPHTKMYAFPSLSDKQVWQLIHYIRQFSK